MILDLKKHMSCRCPLCTERSYDIVTPFRINGGFNSECSVCGADFLGIYKTKKGYKFKVSCFICDTAHEFSVSFDGLWNKKILSFGCPLTGVDLLYVGDKAEVYDVAIEADKMFSGFDEIPVNNDYFENLPPLFEEAFKILNNRLTSERITCPCGHTEMSLKISQNGITVICECCDAKLFIPVAVPEDIERLDCMKAIELK